MPIKEWSWFYVLSCGNVNDKITEKQVARQIKHDFSCFLKYDKTSFFFEGEEGE